MTTLVLDISGHSPDEIRAAAIDAATGYFDCLATSLMVLPFDAYPDALVAGVYTASVRVRKNERVEE